MNVDRWLAGSFGLRCAVAPEPLPIRTLHLADPVIVPAPFAEEVLALDADLAVAGLHQRAAARLVLGERPGGQLVQVELAERVVGPDAHRLGGATLPPLGGHADHDAGGGARMEPIDLMDAGRPDGAAVGL